MPLSIEVIDKRVQSGARQLTMFYLEVDTGEDTREISVPIQVYYEKDVGDRISVMYYSGALGYSYYNFESNAGSG